MYLRIRVNLSILHGIGNGYAEAEAFGNAESTFYKILGSGNVLEAF